MLDAEKAADSIIDSVKGFVSRSFERLSERIAEIEGRIDETRRRDAESSAAIEGTKASIADAVNSFGSRLSVIEAKTDEAANTERFRPFLETALDAVRKEGGAVEGKLRIFAKEAADEAVKQIPAPKDGRDAGPVDIAAIVAEVEAKIPKPKDGKDAEVDYGSISREIAALVAKAIDEIPKPQDGKDADPDVIRAEVEKAAERITGSVKESAAHVIGECVSDEVAKAIKALPVPQDGKDGRDAEVDVEKIVSAVVSKIPVPKDGEPGKDADPEIILAQVEKAVAEIPKPKETPIEVVSALVAGEVAKAVAQIPKPEKARDGENGRDALQIEILPAIDSAKAYPRGTFASHRGGLWRSWRNTDPGDDLQLCGWHPIVEGFPDIEIVQGDDFRTITLRAASSSGRKTEKSFSVPVLIDRGVYKAETQYAPGDVTSYSGSIWIAQTETREAPGVGAGWRLSVKRGRDGKDFEPPEKKSPEPIRLK